ncbi:MAG: Holliday junction resolvase RuvX [Gammaproteobacteria bacterium]|jgi:putative Holliday junction resolvase
MPEAARSQGILLGFDYGRRRTGVAVGQPLTGSATPLTTLTSSAGKPDWEAIEQLVREWHPNALVVGLPERTHGGRHPLHKEIHAFCAELERRFGLPVYTVNETLTSAEAEADLTAARRAGRKRRIAREEIDTLSAALILETWMADQP